MGCRLTKGSARDCAFTIGGITNLYATNLSSIDTWTAAVDGTLTNVTFTEVTITGVTNASPPVVTAAGHGLVEGQKIFITGTSPMTGLIGQHTVGNVLTVDTFELEGEDSTGWGAYGVTAAVVQIDGWHEVEFDINTSSINGDFVVSNGNRFFNQGVNVLIPTATNATKQLVEELALTKTVWIAKTNDGNLKVVGKTNGVQLVTAPYTSGVQFGDFSGFNLTLSGAEKSTWYIYDETVNPLQIFTN